MNNQPNWNDINFKKESSMAWLNAMNNACVIVSSLFGNSDIKNRDEVVQVIEFFRDKIYKLNMTKIDHDATSAVSEEDLV